MKILIDKSWNGDSRPEDEHASARLTTYPASLEIEVHAPFNGDPPPAGAPGSTDQLWTHEVVELFLLGTDGRYLEVELGPHGHYLALLFAGPRQPERGPLPIDYSAQIQGARWSGLARIPRDHLPGGITRGNAYAIRGLGDRRCYYAAWPVPGQQPDFHQPEFFGPLQLQCGPPAEI